jgi:transcriptional regulator with XRE-family HTH domain
MPTAEQIRAARGLLNWSRPDLAKALGVSLSTIVRIERVNARRPILIRALRAVFEEQGVEFVPGGARRRQTSGSG